MIYIKRYLYISTLFDLFNSFNVSFTKLLIFNCSSAFLSIESAIVCPASFIALFFFVILNRLYNLKCNKRNSN